MYTIKTQDCFYTRERKLQFKINVNCAIRLSEDNIVEIIQKGSSEIFDKDVTDRGIHIRETMTQEQKDDVISLINRITKKDFKYCSENKVITLSGHIIDDLKNKTWKFVQREWATNLDELKDQVVRTLCNVIEVEKAKISFKLSGESNKTLTYTVIGKENGSYRALAVNFKSHIFRGNIEEIIMAVTILPLPYKYKIKPV